jgi:hypothetical protein
VLSTTNTPLLLSRLYAAREEEGLATEGKGYVGMERTAGAFYSYQRFSPRTF